MTGILSYSASFVLGLLHAFEPGHGKSILAAFSLKETNIKVFSSLIFSLFISHFLVLALFAWALQSLSNTELVESYSDYLQLLSPVLVIAFGGYLLYNARKHRKTESGCSCGHNHDKDELSSTKTASITGLITGLMPCPTAIAPLVISGVHDGFNTTLVHILVYVIGMTLALFGFTAILLIAKSLFHKQFSLSKGKLDFNTISASIILVVGVIYLITNIVLHDTHH